MAQQKVSSTFSLDAADVDALQKMHEKTGVSKSGLIRRMIQQAAKKEDISNGK